MNLDVRIPIGLMFSLFGAVLVIFGVISDQAIYEQHSLGININLGWGVVLLIFGVVMLALARRGRAKWEAAVKSDDAGQDQSHRKP